MTERIFSFRYLTLASILSIGVLCFALYFIYQRDDCELLDYLNSPTERIGDRQFVVVLEDRDLFDRGTIKKVMLPLFSDVTTYRVMFCNGSILRHLREIRSSALYSFGKRNTGIEPLDREPSSLCIVFPTCPPPKKHFSFTTSVVLRTTFGTEDLNSQWKRWCVEQNAPYFEVKGEDVLAMRHGIEIVNEMLVTARKKQAALEYQEYLRTHKN